MKADLNKKAMASNYATAMIRVCEEFDVTETALLRDTGMEGKEEPTGTSMLAINQIARLTQNALNLTGIPHLGLIFGQKLNVTAHGMLGIAVMSSRTVWDALQIACQYYRTRSSIFSANTYVQGEKFYFTVEPDAHYGQFTGNGYAADQVLQFTLEAVFSSFHTIARLLSPNHSQYLTYQFTCPKPGYASEFEHYLGKDVHFDQPVNCISGSATYTAVQLPFYDEATLSKALSDCQNSLQKQQVQSNLSLRIEELLEEMVEGLPDIEQMAQRLNMSSRTLRRKLQTEGTSYQGILNEKRLAMAKRLLSQTDMSILDIACELDFNDPSYFTKMFKRWTGFLPNEYRKHRELPEREMSASSPP